MTQEVKCENDTQTEALIGLPFLATTVLYITQNKQSVKISTGLTVLYSTGLLL